MDTELTAARDSFVADWIERFRKTLMEKHADDWDMETVSEAAHICAEQMAVWFFGPCARALRGGGDEGGCE